MVGMYYKRREERSQNKFLRVLSKYMINIFAILIVGFVLVVFFINGDTIKRPLSAYLSKVLDTEVSIGSADFSPLYPNVMRLSDINFGSSKINELYVEYDVMSLVNSDELKLQDLYINGMTLNEDDWLKLKNSQLGFTKVQADLLRLNHIPLHIANIQSNDLNLRLEKASYAHNELSFSQGRMNALEAWLFGEKVTNLGMVFQKSNNGFFLKDFSVGLMGGTISGSGVFHPADLDKLLASSPDRQQPDADPNDGKSTINFKHGMQTLPQNKVLDATTSQEAQAVLEGFQGFDSGSYVSSLGVIQPSVGYIDFDDLYLTKIIMPKSLTLPGNVSVTAKNAVLSDVIVTSQSPSAIKKQATTINNISVRSSDKPRYDAPENIPAIDANAESTNIVPQSDNDSGVFVLQGINGNITDFKLEQGRILGSFIGKIDEISLPNLQTVFEQNQGSLRFNNKNLDFELTGKLYEGDYAIDGIYTPDQSLLVLNQLKLNRNKLELTENRWKFLSQKLPSYYIKLGSLTFNQLEFLSYINAFPVSVQNISGHAINWILNNPQRNVRQSVSANSPTPQAAMMNQALKATPGMLQAANTVSHKDKLRFNIEGDQTTRLNLELINVLYSNLRLRSATCKVTLADDVLNIDLPKVHFDESYVSAQASLGLTASNAESSFSLKAYDFETADLNSNLMNHLLTGKINLDVDLKAQHDELEQIWHNLEGKITLTSDILLISDFGLDLINGGPQKNYVLTGTELMSAMQGNAAGISNLKLSSDFVNHQAYIDGSMNLATAFANIRGQMDLNNQALQGESMLSSLAQDSTTKVDFAGTWQNPSFTITALKRGAQRPGLYLPQYEASAFAKEPTDTLLKGFEDVVPVHTDTNTVVNQSVESKVEQNADQSTEQKNTQSTEQNVNQSTLQTTQTANAQSNANTTVANDSSALNYAQKIDQKDSNKGTGNIADNSLDKNAEQTANTQGTTDSTAEQSNVLQDNQSTEQTTNPTQIDNQNAAQTAAYGQTSQADTTATNTEGSTPTAYSPTENSQSAAFENTEDKNSSVLNPSYADSANQSKLNAELTDTTKSSAASLAHTNTDNSNGEHNSVENANAANNVKSGNADLTHAENAELNTDKALSSVTAVNAPEAPAVSKSDTNTTLTLATPNPSEAVTAKQDKSKLEEQSALSKDNLSPSNLPKIPEQSAAHDNASSVSKNTELSATTDNHATTSSTDTTAAENSDASTNTSSDTNAELTNVTAEHKTTQEPNNIADSSLENDNHNLTITPSDEVNSKVYDSSNTKVNNSSDAQVLDKEQADTNTVNHTDDITTGVNTADDLDTTINDEQSTKSLKQDMEQHQTDSSESTKKLTAKDDENSTLTAEQTHKTNTRAITDATNATDAVTSANDGATNTTNTPDSAKPTISDPATKVIDSKTTVSSEQPLDGHTRADKQPENNQAESNVETTENATLESVHATSETSAAKQSETLSTAENLSVVDNNSTPEPSEAAVLDQQADDESLKKQAAVDTVKNQDETERLKNQDAVDTVKNPDAADGLKKQAENEAMKKQADEIENNLLEKALFDSFFSFQEQDEQDKLPQDSEKKSQQVFKFNDSDDEMIF